jgi:hypothetical protein
MRDISQSDPVLLAEMMDLSSGFKRIWRPGELGAILRHQLAATVQFDLGSLDVGLRSRLSDLTASENLLLKSFGDLFSHPHPPVELLELTKEFAKANRSHPDSAYPDAVSEVLYFLSIAVAMVRCGQRISQLDDDSLRRGMAWVASQEWVDEKMKSVLAEAQAMLKAKAGDQHE